MLKICIDTNVWISGVIFQGPPSAVVTAALSGRYEIIASTFLIDEIERNLIYKFDFSKANTKRLIRRILENADLYEPQGTVKAIRNHKSDNLILETAFLGGARYLITGDREHLLPLKSYRMIRIIEPVHFLNLIRKS